MLQIRCKNNNVTKSFPEGTSLLDVYQEFQDEIRLPYPVVSAKVNNVSQGLKFRLYQNRDVEFLDARDGSGHRAYIRSLSFVLYKATQDLFSGSKLFIEHSLCRGYYCNFKKRANEPLTDDDVERIRQRMLEIVDLDMPFRRTESTTEEAIRVFTERGFADKVKLLETSGQLYSDYYTLGDTVDYFYGPLVPSAGYLRVWGLERYEQGLLLRVPDWDNPSQVAEKVEQPRTFEMFAEKTRWDIIMRLSNAGDVNKAIRRGQASELIQVSEALQEKKIVQIAEEIDRRFHRKKKPVRLGPVSYKHL
ncbi:MAG: nucleoside kinase, partial [Prevotella sp.]|nr:nucleoside kinase [Prevotella sp.]